VIVDRARTGACEEGSVAIQFLRRPQRRLRECADRYLREIRDIAAGGFSRRELLKMGLVMGAEGLWLARGMRGFRPYWAYAAADGAGLTLTSPPNTPFLDPLPIPRVATPTTLSPAPTRGRNPIASALTNFFEANRPDHQRWTDFGGSADAAAFASTQYEIVARAVQNDFYPAVDGRPPSTIWTYADASALGADPLNAAVSNAAPVRINAHYGAPILMRMHNALPDINDGFGINQISTHLHNGHSPAESDGGPLSYHSAGTFWDFHYPLARAGFASTHPTSSLNGRTVSGDVHETMSFLWFHDHRLDFTSQNVYKGLAAFFTVFSDDLALDTGDETTGLRLPSGDYDIPLIVADKVFDSDGRLFFDLFNLDGVLGDKYTVNGKIQPYLEVKRRKYRFRILDGGPSRSYAFTLSNGQPFTILSSDGNLLPRPLTRTMFTLGVAERTDVIVDFSGAAPGSKIYMQNRLEQVSGRGPTGRLIAPTNLLEFRVTDDAVDDSAIPAVLLDVPARRTPSRSREWSFDRDGGAWTINGEFFDPTKIRAFIPQNACEQWTFKSGGGWQHPVHVHMEEFQVLSRDGNRPPAEEQGRKDVLRVGQAALGPDGVGESSVLMNFRDWLGDYPMHCHNTVHEDHAMMIQFRVVP
jgi:FtsP/CotA-like multicopper oxidase with cupredoxin domain